MKELVEKLIKQIKEDAKQYEQDGKEQEALILRVIGNSMMRLLIKEMKNERDILQIESSVMIGLAEKLQRGEKP